MGDKPDSGLYELQPYDSNGIELVLAHSRQDSASVQQQIDQLDNANSDDAHRWSTLGRVILALINTDLETAVQEFDSLKREPGDVSPLFHAVRLFLEALIGYRKGDHDRADTLCQQSLDALPNLDDLGPRGFITTTYGQSLTNRGDLERPFELYEEFLAEAEKRGRDRSACIILYWIGSNRYFRGDYADSLARYERSLSYAKSLKSPQLEVSLRSQIASVYAHAGEIETALKYNVQALDQAQLLKDERQIIHAHTHQAITFILDDRFDEALKHIEISFGYPSAGNDVAHYEHYTRLKAWCLSELGQTDEAETVFATVGAHEPDHTLAKLDHYFVQSKIKLAQGDREGARRSALRALEVMGDFDRSNRRVMLYQQLRDLALQENDLQEYVRYNDLFVKAQEQLNGRQTSAKIAILDRQREIERMESERERERAVLYSTLPQHVADRVIKGETIEDHFENAAVLFADIAGFTTHTASMHPSETLKLLEDLYRHFDAICKEHGFTKVKTIGDSYLCFTGDGSAEENALAAADVATAIANHSATWPSGEPLVIRIGVHIGPVSAGIIGAERLQYDIWGDTVNVASRMESTGEAGRIQVSESFAQLVANRYTLDARGEVDIKGKGSMTTYWLEGA